MKTTNILANYGNTTFMLGKRLFNKCENFQIDNCNMFKICKHLALEVTFIFLATFLILIVQKKNQGTCHKSAFISYLFLLLDIFLHLKKVLKASA